MSKRRKKRTLEQCIRSQKADARQFFVVRPKRVVAGSFGSKSK